MVHIRVGWGGGGTASVELNNIFNNGIGIEVGSDFSSSEERFKSQLCFTLKFVVA